MLLVFCALLSYLAGSLSSAIIVCKLLQLPDPRTEGSKNPGTTNVLRLGGKKAAIIVLLGDVLKGVIPVLVAKQLGVQGTMLAWIGVCAFLGHLYPVFFSFAGGKGVATAIGIILALSPASALLLILTWLSVAKLSQYSSLAALTATTLAPLYVGYFTGISYLPGIITVCILLIIRHRDNIQRLRLGIENKIKL